MNEVYPNYNIGDIIEKYTLSAMIIGKRVKEEEACYSGIDEYEYLIDLGNGLEWVGPNRF